MSQAPADREGGAGFVELGVTTNFSFLRGGSHPEELVVAAHELGLAGIGIADRNSVAGVARAFDAHQRLDPEVRPRLLIGARLIFADGTPDILAYPSDRDAYGRLTRLLTVGKRAAKKGECHLRFADLADHHEGLLFILMPPRYLGGETARALGELAALAPGRVWLAATMLHRGDDRRGLAKLKALAAARGVPLIATNDVLYHTPARRALQDVVTCIREHVTLERAGRLLEANAERHLKAEAEIARLFRGEPEAVAETRRFAGQIQFSLHQLKYRYPDEPVPPGKTAQRHLEDLTWAGARAAYPRGIPDRVLATLVKELALIEKLDYAHYFLTVHDIVRFARSRNILCQGRGSAANSAVCYVLGITAVDPTEVDLLFERFVSQERREPPDIDVDFEHERREEVIQYIYERYGRHRAGIAATVIRYRPRSAVREVGKAFGLTEDITSALAGTVWGSWGEGLVEDQIRQAGLDPANPAIRRVVELVAELIGFPRHLSQHVGGFVLTQGRLDEMVPVGNAAMADRTFIEWDKDDIDTLGMMKVDVLALGMLTCIRKAFDLIAEAHGERWTLAGIPREDARVYDMLCAGDSLGVFQVESRAQMNMLPRLKPRDFYDLVIEVAIVRPGPIQGDMVHPYLRRRQNPAEVAYPGPSPEHGPPDELRRVLEKTLGVPLFQEQAMRIAIEAAKFTPGEANQLRRSMATFRHLGDIHKFRDRMVGNMIKRGYPPDFAERCFKQIEGFGTYGFPESHAASFAGLVYASSWLKRHYPAAFACALLNSQPMGFYAPAQIVRDAREHGVEVRAVDINASFHDNTLEQAEAGPALRLGFRQIDGFGAAWSEMLTRSRGEGYATLEELARRARPPKRAALLLADADAFRSIGLDRRRALWEVRRLPDDAPLPLFAARDVDDTGEERAADLPAMALSEHVVADYQTLRLSLKAHPLRFLRPRFSDEGLVTCRAVARARDGMRARCAGLVLVRQRPGSAKGVVFMTLEDETGIANVVVWPAIMARFRRQVMGSRLVEVDGRIQRGPEGVVHLIADRLVDRSGEIARLSDGSLDHDAAFAGGLALIESSDDARAAPAREDRYRHRHPRDVRVLPKSRDFH